jgi:hypothetical protein
MAQIIDIEERRKPRAAPRVPSLPGLEPNLLDPTSYVEVLVLPLAVLWRSWIVSWGSVWLAPLGLQVITVEPTPPVTPKDRAGPRG